MFGTGVATTTVIATWDTLLAQGWYFLGASFQIIAPYVAFVALVLAGIFLVMHLYHKFIRR